MEGGPLDTESECDRRLSVGASIACRIRGAVWEKLGEPPAPEFPACDAAAGNAVLMDPASQLI